jgi:hypothetical protein
MDSGQSAKSDFDHWLRKADDFLALGEPCSAITAYHKAKHSGAPADRCSAGCWHAHMLLGEFRAAWEESDAIRRRGAPDPHRFWSGEDIRGKKVILRCLHGFGDAVQFLRYVPRVRSLVSHLIIEVAPRFLEVAPYFEGVEDVIAWGGGQSEDPVKWDLQIEIMELPYLFRTEHCELPLATKYLTLPAKTKTRAVEVMSASKLPKIGLVWAAGEWNPERSLSPSLLKPILESPGCQFWSLQGGAQREEWRTLPGSCRPFDGFRCGDGILPLAAAISQLELLITVDTLAAHLAGAQGIPTWLLLPYAADWRWMIRRRGSPWYPSMRLFRQAAPSDWNSVVRQLQCELTSWLDQSWLSAKAG